jgi:hypothetical protein
MVYILFIRSFLLLSLTIIYAPCRFLRLALSAFLRHSDDFSLGLISQKSTQIVSRGMDVYTVLEAPHLKRRIPLPDCLLTIAYATWHLAFDS